MESVKIKFTGQSGQELAARLDRPKGPVVAYALFAHCFTCSKDVFAVSRIARNLAEHGIATFRFDFTGLGHSEGDFANETFSSNVEDLVAAACNDAVQKLEQVTQERMGSLTEGLNLPPGMKMPF